MRGLLILTLLVTEGGAAQTSSPVLLTPQIAQGALPDSIRMKMLAMIADGNIAGAVDYYLLATGATTAPRWLTAFQSAFSTTNRIAGPCQRVAETILEGFKQLGRNPEMVKFTTNATDGAAGRIGFSVGNGQWIQVATNGFHVAVKVGDRIYDAFTGPAGLVLSEYLSRLQPGLQRYPIVMQ